MPNVTIRDRIAEFKRIPAAKIVENPGNWRKHPEGQREALRLLLKSIGFASACLVRKLDDDKYMLVDGHLRHDEMATLGKQPIPCLILDVTEEEADTLLATVDPLGAMAEADGGKLADLITKLDPGDEAMIGLFSAIGKRFIKEKKGGDDEILPELPADGAAPEASHVRMVQLFLTTETLDDFREKLNYLGDKYGTDTITDTVRAVIQRLYEIEKGKEDGKE